MKFADSSEWFSLRLEGRIDAGAPGPGGLSFIVDLQATVLGGNAGTSKP